MNICIQNRSIAFNHISTSPWHITISRRDSVNSITSPGRIAPICWSNLNGILLNCTLSVLTTHCPWRLTNCIQEFNHTRRWPVKCTKKSVNNCMSTKQEILGLLLFFVLMIGVSVLIAWHKGHINEGIIDTINSVRSDSCVHGTRFIISCRSTPLPDA